MITIKIREWTPIGGITQTGTSYQVATDRAFTNIVDNNPNDTTNITVYYSPVVIPVNTTYYVRVMRHFSDGTTSGWGEVIGVSNTTANGGVIVYDPIKVYQPVVSVDAGLLDPVSTTYTVSTSSFVGVNEGHGYTVWVVLNDKNEVLEFVKSTTQLTSITFTKSVTKFLNTKYVKILAIHGTFTNVESPAGELINDLTTVNFTISVLSDVVSPSMDLEVFIHRTPNAVNNQVSKIVLKDTNNTEIWTTPVTNINNSVIIPGSLFVDDTQYLLFAYGTPADEQHTYVIGVHTRPVAALSQIDRGYKYSQKVRLESNVARFPSTTNFVSEELFNSKIMLPFSNGVMQTIINPDGTFQTPTAKTANIALGPISSNCAIIPLPGDTLLFDYANATASVTNIYSMDYYNNVATVTHSTNNTGKSLAYNNGVVVVSPTEYYTARIGTKTLVLNTITPGAATIAKSTIPLPKGETFIELVTEDQGNNLLVFCKNSTKIYRYDIATGTYITKYTLPVEFRGRTLKKQLLVNGDVIVWKPVISETVNGTVVNDTVLDMLYINNSNSTMNLIKPYSGLTSNIEGSVLLNSGKVLLVMANATGPNALVFE